MLNTECPEECRHWIGNYSGAVYWAQVVASLQVRKMLLMSIFVNGVNLQSKNTNECLCRPETCGHFPEELFCLYVS